MDTNKPWDEMSDAERIEELRGNVLSLINFVNQLGAKLDHDRRRIADLERRLQDLEKPSGT